MIRYSQVIVHFELRSTGILVDQGTTDQRPEAVYSKRSTVMRYTVGGFGVISARHSLLIARAR